MARPRKAPEEKRDDQLNPRLTAAERAEIERNAAALGRVLAASGHEVPLTDLVVAALAQRVEAFGFSTDPHFDLIPGLKRYR